MPSDALDLRFPGDSRDARWDDRELVESLCEEMVRRWQSGERPKAEEFINRIPDPESRPESALELIAEELSLRRELSEPAELVDLERRFPHWRAQVRTLVQCHELLGPETTGAPFPTEGDRLGEFDLLAELGRGANGRVFLAKQPSLAGRPVVLKLSPDGGAERHWLGRLQHTNIVPLFSVHQFPERGLCGLCLPYLGGMSLQQILRRLGPPERRSGKDLVEALKQSQTDAPVKIPVEGPACRFFDRASFVQAACWVGMCLAEALQYAHERNLLHLDLKPSNVLLAADGQPLLLDFHLANEALPAGAMPPAVLGGTPGYMAPEHQAALQAAREGRTVPFAVDGRADIYSLGALLVETLSGSIARAGTTAQRLRSHHAPIKGELAVLLEKCLAADPAHRYPTASALAGDLRCFLSGLPLKEATSRHAIYRLLCWSRRRPWLASLAPLLTAGLVVIGLLLGHAHRQATEARAALRQGQRFMVAGQYAKAGDRFQEGLDRLENVPWTGELVQELREEAALADRAQGATDLHRSCERLRECCAAPALSADEIRRAFDLCEQIWQNREMIARRLEGQPVAEQDQQVRADLIDVAILWSRLRVEGASPESVRRARQDAFAVLRQAEERFGPTPSLLEAQRVYLQPPNDFPPEN